jgi:hypothetical protein
MFRKPIVLCVKAKTDEYRRNRYVSTLPENLRREIDSSRTSEGLASQQRCYAGGFLVICDGEEEGEMIAARPA